MCALVRQSYPRFVRFALKRTRFVSASCSIHSDCTISNVYDTCATVAVFETTHVMLVEVNDSVTDEV